MQGCNFPVGKGRMHPLRTRIGIFAPLANSSFVLANLVQHTGKGTKESETSDAQAREQAR